MEFRLNNSYIIIRETPWDSEVLGNKTIEIIDIFYNNTEEIKSLFALLESYCISNKVAYSNVRIASNEKLLTYSLQLEGYRFIESSIKLSINPLNIIPSTTLNKLLNKISLRDYNESFLFDLIEIVSTNFHHGRFAEDYLIANDINVQRNTNWLKQLVKSTNFKMLMFNEKVVGFMSYKINENLDCELILGGVDNKYSHLAYSFWYSVLIEIKSVYKIKSIKTLVSTSNIGVINLYIKMGFMIEQTYWGFSKMRNI